MSCNNTIVEMECVNRRETYPAETITLGFDITGCTLSRELRRKETNSLATSWTSASGGSITIDNAAGGIYTVPKWVVNLPAGNYVGKDVITYANGDVQVLWELTLKVDE